MEATGIDDFKMRLKKLEAFFLMGHSGLFMNVTTDIVTLVFFRGIIAKQNHCSVYSSATTQCNHPQIEHVELFRSKPQSTNTQALHRSLWNTI